MAEKKKYLEYKGKPFIRRGNTIFYGDPTDDFMIELLIQDTTPGNGIEISGNIMIQLINNNRSGKDHVVKTAQRDGLFAAMAIAEFWLLDALGEIAD